MAPTICAISGKTACQCLTTSKDHGRECHDLGLTSNLSMAMFARMIMMGVGSRAGHYRGSFNSGTEVQKTCSPKVAIAAN